LSPREEDAVNELASLAGIEPEYYDIWGNLHPVAPGTKKAILTAMGLGDIEARLRERRQRPWNRLIEPAMVVAVGAQPATVPVHFPLEEGREAEVRLSWQVTDEAGSAESFEMEGVSPSASAVIDGARHVRVELPNDRSRGLGYYEFSVRCRGPAGEISGDMLYAVTPDRCFVPEGRTWGIHVNLYAVRSERNLGVGDLADLASIVRWAGGELCAGFVGISPLHATPNEPPHGISPYSATSRLYRNYIYLDLDRVPGAEAARGLLESEEFRRDVEALRQKDLIDYEAVAFLKKKALRAAFDALDLKGREAAAYRRYVKREGRRLELFATFLALSDHMKGRMPQAARWQDWPEEYLNPAGPAVEHFRRGHRREVAFHKFLQWAMEEQLAEAARAGKEAGMSVGLYQDIAVGSSGQGSDAWSHPELFAFGATAGAPPDSFNMNGQDWGFPPLIPDRLRESRYGLFIETIRKNMRHAGALRIDHALGLFRLFWIPEGATPTEGCAYVRYPDEDLLRLIALESVRNRTVVIAEDLGTVSDEVRRRLQDFGMLSYRLFYFERQWPDRSFKPPGEYPELALAAVNTHDLPTLCGYWRGRDIEVKNSLGIYPDEASWQRDLWDRQADRRLMLEAVGPFLPEGFPRDAEAVPEMTQALSVSVHNFLARTPCKLVAVSLDDMTLAPEQQNLPGTVMRHPNWRRKSPVSLAEVFRSRHARDLAAMFRRELRASGPCNAPQPRI